MFIIKNKISNEITESLEILNGWEDITNNEEGKLFSLKKAKEAKIAQLKVNLDNASKKPFPLNGVKQIDKDGKVIGTVNASFNIYDGSSLTNAENIIFAGSIMKIQAFLKLLCIAIGKDFDAMKAQVNALSDNPATVSIANIPYTTKDDKGNEIRVLLSFQKIEEIFAHVFTRVATKTNLYNIIEEKIKKATSIEELDKIDINLN